MQIQRNACALGALIIVLHFNATANQIDQSDLAQWMRSDFPEQRQAALAAVERLGPKNADASLRAAMMNTLIREANVHRQRYYDARSGRLSHDIPDPEFVSKLALAVIELHDPKAIPALSAALFGPPVVALELANFGEAAAASVLRVVTAPEAWYDDVAGGLISLRFMVEQRHERPLSPATIAQIRRAAAQRLEGEQHFTILWRAIDLAFVLGDPQLEDILEALASDPSELSARGMTDPDLVDLTRRRVSDRLAGVPPQPRLTDVLRTPR